MSQAAPLHALMFDSGLAVVGRCSAGVQASSKRFAFSFCQLFGGIARNASDNASAWIDAMLKAKPAATQSEAKRLEGRLELQCFIRGPARCTCRYCAEVPCRGRR